MTKLDQFMDELRREVAAVKSPWRTREGAAAYLGLSLKSLDRLKRQGRLQPKYVGDRPLYHVSQLDKVPVKLPRYDTTP